MPRKDKGIRLPKDAYDAATEIKDRTGASYTWIVRRAIMKLKEEEEAQRDKKT